MADRRIYKTPPIQDAVYELRYQGRDAHDLRDLQKFITLLPPEYSGAATPSVDVQPIVQSATRSVGFTLRGPNVQVASADQKKRIILGRDSVAAHCSAPYCGWDALKPDVISSHNAFCKVYSPTGLTRMAVRYINRIVVPLEDLVLQDYFIGLPTIPMPSEPHLSRILERVIGELPETSDTFALSFASTDPTSPGTSQFLLDIEVSRNYAPETLPDDITEAVEVLRVEERDLFECMITPKTRALFDA